MHNSLSESLIPVNSEKIQPLKKSSQTLTSTINTNKIYFLLKWTRKKKKKKSGRCFPVIYTLGYHWCWEKPVYALLLGVIQDRDEFVCVLSQVRNEIWLMF